jgi:hypothetical protein
MLDKLLNRGSRPDLLATESIDFHVALVAEQELIVAIEDHDSQGEIVDGSLEQPARLSRLWMDGLLDGIRHVAPGSGLQRSGDEEPAIGGGSW